MSSAAVVICALRVKAELKNVSFVQFHDQNVAPNSNENQKIFEKTAFFLQKVSSQGTANVSKFQTLVACQKGLDKQCRPRSDCF